MKIPTNPACRRNPQEAPESTQIIFVSEYASGATCFWTGFLWGLLAVLAYLVTRFIAG